jgi:hypothetical protein
MRVHGLTIYTVVLKSDVETLIREVAAFDHEQAVAIANEMRDEYLRRFRIDSVTNAGKRIWTYA